MSLLSKKESKIVSGLRFPLIRKDTPTNAEYLSMLTDKELLELYEKMDSYISEEGRIRTSLGLYDEMYFLELSFVKEKLKSEYEKRMDKNRKKSSI